MHVRAELRGHLTRARREKFCVTIRLERKLQHCAEHVQALRSKGKHAFTCAHTTEALRMNVLQKKSTIFVDNLLEKFLEGNNCDPERCSTRNVILKVRDHKTFRVRTLVEMGSHLQKGSFFHSTLYLTKGVENSLCDFTRNLMQNVRTLSTHSTVRFKHDDEIHIANNAF